MLFTWCSTTLQTWLWPWCSSSLEAQGQWSGFKPDWKLDICFTQNYVSPMDQEKGTQPSFKKRELLLRPASALGAAREDTSWHLCTIDRLGLCILLLIIARDRSQLMLLVSSSHYSEISVSRWGMIEYDWLCRQFIDLETSSANSCFTSRKTDINVCCPKNKACQRYD